MRSSKCRGCHATIWWGITPKGAKIPLTKVANVYQASHADPDRERLIAYRDPEQFYVSHFEVCPEAGKFGKNKRAAR